MRRAVEMHWRGEFFGEGGADKSCVHGGNQTARAMCPLLMGYNTGEFIYKIPVFVLECYGWKMPGFAADTIIHKARFDLQNIDERGHKLRSSDRYVRMEIDMQPRKKTHLAIKLSVIPHGEKQPEHEPFLVLDEPDNPPLATPY